MQKKIIIFVRFIFNSFNILISKIKNQKSKIKNNYFNIE